jgi:hypothetical protein
MRFALLPGHDELQTNQGAYSQVELDWCDSIEVRYCFNSDQIPQRCEMTRCARSGSECTHSITSSASDSKVEGTAMLSALATLARSAGAICVTIGEILRAFAPNECANYFRNSARPNPKSIMP